MRLRLRNGERIRLLADGMSGPWIDPFEAAGAPAPAAVQTPAWALGTVWYNIFPERFDNAEPSNDQGWPHGTPIPWEQDWFEATADEFEASANRAIALPRRYGDDHDRRRPVLREGIFERRYGGDLEGAMRRLDHIRTLGAESIWFCPVFRSTSLHKYDAADHRHIDPYLAGVGSPASRGEPAPFSSDPADWIWTEADRVFVDQFLPAAKSQGMRVILDGVWNHVGLRHPAFEDAIERGQASPYWDWFEITPDEQSQVASWRAWDRRSGALPVFRQFPSPNPGDAHLHGHMRGQLADGPKDHVFAVTDRWMDPDADGDPSDGIDGWRLDVANEVGIPFWRDWRAHVRSINPDAILFGELWFDGSDYFNGVAFDAQMNYPLAFALTGWLGREPSMTSERFVETVRDRVFVHHPATVLAQMNLVSSHDTPRFASMIANPGREYDRDAGMAAAGFDRSRPSEAVYDLVELGYAILTALPGSPMVYNGDELGMWAADDPENRMPIQWPPDNRAAAFAERVGSWLRLRQDPRFGDALKHGGWSIEQDGEIIIVRRWLDDVVVELGANRSIEPQPWTGGTLPPRSAQMRWSAMGGTRGWTNAKP
ncbi:MAG: alpha-amylase family glycosyl hydrolase [Planctomycetota bacterium]